jgi:adenine deaminase
VNEAIEKLRKGMHIMLRQGTHEKNLQDLIPIINNFNSFHISFVSDDRDPIDLKEKWACRLFGSYSYFPQDTSSKGDSNGIYQYR